MEMKTKIFSLLIGLVIVSLAKSNAQSFKYGLLGGYNIVNIHQTNWDTFGPPFRSMMSYNVNCFISYKSKGIWGYSIEPGFIQKGGSNGVQNRCRWELNYLQIPFSINAYILPKFILSIGPEFAYMITANLADVGFTDDIGDTYKKKFEVSGLIGIKYMITKRIDIGLRYNHGMTYLRRVPVYGDNHEILDMARQYNRYFQLTISFNCSK